MKRRSSPAAIVGVGETSYLRRGTESVTGLVIEAVDRALADSGLSGADVDMVITEGGLMPSSVRVDEVARSIGVKDSYAFRTVGSFGAGIAGAHLAANEAIAAGSASVVVSYFGVDWGSRTEAVHAQDAPAGSLKYSLERPVGFYGQPVYFAAMANRYQKLYGGSLEAGLGRLAVELRKHAVANGHGQMTKDLSQDDYLRSPFVAEPLRVPDCCLLTDGAGATVIVDGERAADLEQVPVFIRGGHFASSAERLDDFFSQSRTYPGIEAVRSATQKALELSGHSLDDMDFIELYDCFTISLLLQLEGIGLCEPGAGLEYAAAANTIGLRSGGTPVNTHGGLLSHSYVLGIEHVIEAVRQLRGTAGKAQVTDAITGLVGLFTGPHYCTLILGRDQ